MALFKILKGKEVNLPSAKKEGYAYFTTDEGHFYVDVDNNTRKQLNAGHAKTADSATTAGNATNATNATTAEKLGTNAGDSNTPVYFSGGKPVACTSLDLNTTGSSASCTGNAATATSLPKVTKHHKAW